METKAKPTVSGIDPKGQSSKYHYYFVRLIISAFVALIISGFTIFRINVNFYDGRSEPSPALPQFGKGQELAGTWRFDRREINKEGNVVKYIFSDRERDTVELHFYNVDRNKPAYKRTACFNVMYKSRGTLSPEETRLLDGIIENIVNREKTNPCRALSWSSLRGLSVQCILYLLLCLLLFDLILLAGRNRPGGIKIPSQPASPLLSVVSTVFIALVCSRLFNAVPWNYIELNGYSFFEGWNSGNPLFYILNDYGMPAIPYRSMILLLAPAGNLALIQSLSLAFNIAAVWLTYVIARRFIRGSLAWIPPVALAVNPVFNICLSEMRGYPFFIMSVLLSVYLFMEVCRKPRPILFFLWLAAQWASVASNPITVAVSAGIIIVYLTEVRGKLGEQAKKMMDTHMILLAAGFAVMVPLALGATGFHIKDTAVLAQAQQGEFGPGMLFYICCASVFLAASFGFRKDFRSVLFLPASLGAAAMSLLMVKHVLRYTDLYFLFVLPLIYISFGILAESLAQASGAKRNWLGVLVVAAAIAGFSTWFLSFVNLKSLFSFDYLSSNASKSKFSNYEISRQPNDLPVLILPKESFYAYLHDELKFNPFNRNLAEDSRFHEVAFPSGETVFQMGNLYTALPSLKNPGGFFNGAFKIVVFNNFDPKRRIGAALFIDSNCRIVKDRPERGFLELYCVPRGK